MNNVTIIARKEFSDLVMDGRVIVLLCVYLLYLSFAIVRFYDLTTTGQLNTFGEYFGASNPGDLCSAYIFTMLMDFCGIIGVVVGCATIAAEIQGHALNTLIVKPVYRNTLINGKILGTLALITAIMVLTACIFTGFVFVIFGEGFSIFLFDYIQRTLVGFGILILYVAVFLALAMLVSVIVNDQYLSLIISTILVFLSRAIRTTSFAGNISLIFPGDQYAVQKQIMCLSPDGLLSFIARQIFVSSTSTIEALVGAESYILGLIILLAIGLLFSYIAFMRRDVL